MINLNLHSESGRIYINDAECMAYGDKVYVHERGSGGMKWEFEFCELTKAKFTNYGVFDELFAINSFRNNILTEMGLSFTVDYEDFLALID